MEFADHPGDVKKNSTKKGNAMDDELAEANIDAPPQFGVLPPTTRNDGDSSTRPLGSGENGSNQE